MEMAVHFSEAELVKASRYTLLAHNAAQMQAQPASGGGAGPTANDPPAGTPASPGTEFQATIAGKSQCRHCHSLGKVPPATNHDKKGSNTLRKALGTPRKRGRDSWGAESKGGKGGKHGKGGKGSKGSKGKGGGRNMVSFTGTQTAHQFGRDRRQGETFVMSLMPLCDRTTERWR
jgi:hypothetical protein